MFFISNMLNSMLYSILYIVVQYIGFIVHQDFTLASDTGFSKQYQQDSANRNVT